MKPATRFSNRCLPLRIANGIGWFVVNPKDVTVEWDGTKLMSSDPSHAKLHFGERIVTFDQGHIFRTDPGWGIWVKGVPNTESGPLQNLEAIIETDQLPYPFAINFRFAAPGKIRLRKGAVLAQLVPYPLASVASAKLMIADCKDEPLLDQARKRWVAAREACSGTKQPWHGYYAKGVDCPFPHQRIIRNDVEEEPA